MSLPYQDLEALETGFSPSASGGITLGSSDQWKTRYSTIKVTSKSLGVWKYVDPSASNRAGKCAIKSGFHFFPRILARLSFSLRGNTHLNVIDDLKTL